MRPENRLEIFATGSVLPLPRVVKQCNSMSNPNDKIIALNVRLKPSEPSTHSQAADYTNVGIAQGIAYVEFRFIEPALLAAIAKTANDGQAAPQGLEGHLVAPVAMGMDVLARLHQQIQQVVVSLRKARQRNPKAES